MAVRIGSERRERAARQLLHVLERRPPEVAEALVEALERFDPAPGLDPELWGPAPSEREYAAAVAAGEETLLKARAEVLDRSWSLDEAASHLSVSPQAIQQQLAAGKLVGFKVAGRWRLPTWQFELEHRPAFKQLRDLQRAFLGDPVALTLWVLRPHGDLGGRPPLATLAAGRVQEVLALAQAAGAAGW